MNYFNKILKINFNRISANNARIVYDLLVSIFSSFSLFLIYFFINDILSLKFFLLPFILLFINFAFGVYRNNKNKNAINKSIALFFSLNASSIFGYLIGIPVLEILIWYFILFLPLIIPRIIFGMVYGAHRELVARVNKGKGPVLIIGGAGYIGCHVVDLLLESGKSVRVLDKLMYGDESILKFKNNPYFELVIGDITDISQLFLAMKDVSSVIHLGGLVGDPACSIDVDFTRHTNIIATRMVKSVAQSMGVERFIFASSCSVYGVSDQEVSETDALNPVSLYAKTKIDSEIELLNSRPDDFCVTILRFATVFGHSLRPRFDLVANLFVAQACQEGKFKITGPGQWRPFIHVKDLARAIVLTLNASPNAVDGQIFNVGSKKLNMTIGTLGNIVRNLCENENIPVKVLIEDNIDDPRNYAVSFTKIEKVLGFKAHETIESGLAEIISLFKKGFYGDYKTSKYNNYVTTKNAVTEFKNPKNLTSIYSPLSETTRH